MQREFIVYVKIARPNKLSTGILSALKSKPEFHNGPSTLVISGRNHSDIVFYETRNSKRQAIAREKELKKLNRKKLTDLVRSANPEMLDISGIWEKDEKFEPNSNFLD